MYIPKLNRETRVPLMHELMVAHPFATLVSVGASGLVASHIPIVLEQDGSERGTLRAHVARANPQWSDLTPSIDALAIFSGPHHYISASWYPGARDDGADVPTWNYVVVHAYGPLRVIENPEWLLAHLVKLADIHEAGSVNPWKVADAPPEYIREQMRGIVGLEMPIRRLEGKWKVSQNRNERDRGAVSQGLADLDTPESLTMKRLVDGGR
ncbi:MAG TPA: FMN-binding negative transcriptional regulator [Acidobacteriaceae bacterium]|jgi:transcriptional regulator|nr:FMN-binding negative transcriptional regulator [Acidobacteriaceae bacterium]